MFLEAERGAVVLVVVASKGPPGWQLLLFEEKLERLWRSPAFFSGARRSPRYFHHHATSLLWGQEGPCARRRKEATRAYITLCVPSGSTSALPLTILLAVQSLCMHTLRIIFILRIIISVEQSRKIRGAHMVLLLPP